MSYTVLARRYRSRSFDELIGQQHVARTLQHAIDNDRTAHAYLFCGTRGVGKTSMARLLAIALNVTDDLQAADDIKNAILQGNDLDVIEIDGASNRGINEARDLIASAGLAPARCQYKIYIIDEVHMLTREAFNALLKTMEEPPSHVKFILCTTEPHRVPATIQSRCQRFDFRPVSADDIAAHLAKVVAAEGLKADAEALIEVARMGDGSVRDALSLLDRLLAGAGELTLSVVTESVGLADRTLISSLVDAIIANDAADSLKKGQDLLATGISIDQAVVGLIEHLHAMLILCTCGADVETLEMTEQRRQAFVAQAAHFDSEGLVYQMAVCDALARSIRGSSVARAQFDAAIVRMAHAHRFADVRMASDQELSPEPTSKKKIDANTSVIAKKEPAAVTSSADVTSPKKVAAVVEKATDIAMTERVSSGNIRVKVKTASNAPSPAGIKSPQVATSQSHERGREIWAQVINAARESSAEQARTSQLAYQTFDGRTLQLRLQDGTEAQAKFLLSQVSVIEEQVGRVAGESLRVELALIDEVASSHSEGATPIESTSAKDSKLEAAVVVEQRQPKKETPSRACLEDSGPVRLAREIFDGMIVRVESEEKR